MKTLTLPLSAIAYHVCEQYHKHSGDIMLLSNSEEDAYLYYQQIKFFSSAVPAFYFPSFDSLPYDRVSPSPGILAERARVLAELAINPNKKLVVTSAANLLRKLPPKDEFTTTTTTISKGALSPNQVIQGLVQNGFVRSSTATEPGEFSLRGEILDIIIADTKGYRLHFAWNKLESIKRLDPVTQISNENLENLLIYPTSEFNLSAKNVANFKGNFLKFFGTNHINDPLYLAISEARHFTASEHLIPLLYEEMTSLFAFLNQPLVLFTPHALQAMKEMESDIEDFYKARLDSNKLSLSSFYHAIPTEKLYFKTEEILQRSKNTAEIVHGDIKNLQSINSLYHKSMQESRPISDLLHEFLALHKGKKITICCPSISAGERIKNMLNTSSL